MAGWTADIPVMKWWMTSTRILQTRSQIPTTHRARKHCLAIAPHSAEAEDNFAGRQGLSSASFLHFQYHFTTRRTSACFQVGAELVLKSLSQKGAVYSDHTAPTPVWFQSVQSNTLSHQGLCFRGKALLVLYRSCPTAASFTSTSCHLLLCSIKM